MGVFALARPQATVALFSIGLSGADGKNEVRAVYGGSGLGMGIAVLIAVWVPELRSGVLTCLGTLMSGMALARAFSLLLERTGSWPKVFLLVELVLAAILFLCR